MASTNCCVSLIHLSSVGTPLKVPTTVSFPSSRVLGVKYNMLSFERYLNRIRFGPPHQMETEKMESKSMVSPGETDTNVPRLETNGRAEKINPLHICLFPAYGSDGPFWRRRRGDRECIQRVRGQWHEFLYHDQMFWSFLPLHPRCH